MIDHRRFKILAATALDFGLSPAEAHELALHRAGCLECRRVEVALMADAEVARHLPRMHAPDHIRDSLVSAATRRQPSVNPNLFLQMVGAAALVIAVVIAGLIWIGSRPIEGPGRFHGWTRLTNTSVFEGGSVQSVVAFGSGFVAVGSVSEGGHYLAALWTSADGSTWSPVPRETTFADFMLARVATRGSTMVAMGYDCIPGGYYCGDSRLLVSTDGSIWRGSTSGSCGCDSYNGLTATRTGFLAVGGNKEAEDTTAPDAAVAISTDGVSWTEAPTTPALRGATMAAAAANQSVIVAVGAATDTPVAWFSEDGMTWTRLSASSAPATGRLKDVAAAGPGFVAVGSHGSSAAVWISTDGRSWQEEPSSATLENASMTRIVPTQAGLFALGSTSQGDGVAWFSTDGTSWTRLPLGDMFRNGKIAAAGFVGSRAVLFGSDEHGSPIVLSSDR